MHVPSLIPPLPALPLHPGSANDYYHVINIDIKFVSVLTERFCNFLQLLHSLPQQITDLVQFNGRCESGSGLAGGPVPPPIRYGAPR